MSVLQISSSRLKPSSQVAKAYDLSAKPILGVITLDKRFNEEKVPIVFQVIDVDTSFTALLGRPWLHQMGAIASSIHQYVKYVNPKGEVEVIRGDDPEMSDWLARQIKAGSHPKPPPRNPRFRYPNAYGNRASSYIHAIEVKNPEPLHVVKYNVTFRGLHGC